MFTIEDKPVEKNNNRDGMTAQIGNLKVGQSILSDKSYQALYSLVKMAKMRKKNPLLGEFAIVPEGDKFRVGRTA